MPAVQHANEGTVGTPVHRWQAEILRAAEQSLEDLARARCAEVVLLRYPRLAVGGDHLDALTSVAHARGFVTARVGVLETRALDTLDGLVRTVGRTLKVPGAGQEAHGLVAALQYFSGEHGRKALADFDDGMRRESAAGDILELARAYLDASRRQGREVARIEAWLGGTELARAEEGPVLAALSPRTAQRALGEITRLVRVLGWRGTLVMFHGAEILTRLPPGRREDAYTVLRELVDNADGGRGMVATQIVVAGGDALFVGPKALGSLRPLATRVLTLGDDGSPPPPHRPMVNLTPPVTAGTDALRGESLPEVRPPAAGSEFALGALVRAAQGLPPVRPVETLSVGHERIDATITALFAHAAMESSVFALLTGAYGAGKTHLLTHLAARALADRRPVFRLSLERLSSDLGQPQRHLRRLLEHAVLPLPDLPSALDRLVAWTRAPKTLKRLRGLLEELSKTQGETGAAARKAVLHASRSASPGLALEGFLSGTDLMGKVSAQGYRQDAYNRLALWITLLDRLDDCRGPVVLIDEAENLYRGGTTRAERRTALRSLSYYCGGTLPGACVVLAITPDALELLRAEAAALLEDVAEQKTVLACEDAAMLRRRLTAIQPMEVPALESGHRIVLAFRVRATHERVRGPITDHDWFEWVDDLARLDVTPREVVRRATDRLETIWWRGSAQSR